jgi:hypothetical protein
MNLNKHQIRISLALRCMRLWSLHPQYLDSKGLVALWREALLAQAVLGNKTRGYKHHPQLLRFKKCKSPRSQIARYLRVIHAEAARRGFNFDRAKVSSPGKGEKICVTRGQLDYEWTHLNRKLRARAPDSLKKLREVFRPKSHPSFHVIAGPVAEWEVLAAKKKTRGRIHN